MHFCYDLRISTGRAADHARLKQRHVRHNQYLFQVHLQLKTARSKFNSLKFNHSIHLMIRLNVFHGRGTFVFIKHGARGGAAGC